MVKREHQNDFKVMIVELLKSGMSLKEVGSEYDLNSSAIKVQVNASGTNLGKAF
ncbi:hypothetical protein [Flavivirga aquatica]|uniref:hypothetical protein n=1 Tax=Flavivirga aquatica TaxID=1849968 RepID=UPI0013F4C769|nr:hypothetical protein [Flavivirga aquatica]